MSLLVLLLAVMLAVRTEMRLAAAGERSTAGSPAGDGGR